MTVSSVRIGVDIGGTFTDIAVTRADGRVVVSKVSSTPDDPGRAVVLGVAAVLAREGIAPSAVAEVVHGTTVGSNTILQKVGAPTGLMTTRGFRDVLEIGRIRTPEMFDLAWDKPTPLVPRRLRVEVNERIGADGSVVRPLDAASVAEAARRLVDAGATAIAICFLNSYVNPAHEQEAERIVAAAHPGVALSASWRVLPEIKEYERTSTTVVNAYLLPVMQRYLASLAAGLTGIGVRAPLLVVASNGGVMGARAAADKPVFAVGSGPAAGVVGAARLGDVAGARDLIAFDMGGTTAKASLVEGGRLSLTSEYEFREGISTPSRFIKASGYMLKVPAVDVAEVGAGGGSIAWIDAGGLLRVGPQSAGAAPGPACYGVGGERATVTDANVVLGYLNPAYLAGGDLPLDAARAHAALRRDVAEPLDVSVIEAAHGVRAVANASMARAIRAVTIERGRDPRDYTLVAFGGSGPVHAVDVARALEIRRVLVPPSPGVFTALGMLASDLEHHFVRSQAGVLSRLPPEALDKTLADLAEEARTTLAAEGYAGDAARVRFAADVRYAGQGSELTVPLAGETLDAGALQALREAFRREYTATYGYATDEELELVSLRAVAVGVREDRLDFRALRVAARPAAAARRAVSFERGAAAVDTPVLDRDGVTTLRGPTILESYESTVVVPPGCVVERQASGSLVIAVAP